MTDELSVVLLCLTIFNIVILILTYRTYHITKFVVTSNLQIWQSINNVLGITRDTFLAHLEEGDDLEDNE